MAQKKRKPVLAKQPESTTSTRLLQLMFLASYVALGYLFFTDGDLRRWLVGGGALTTPVNEAMTVGGTTLQSQSRAIDAKEILMKRKITAAPVVDENGKLTGAINLQDFYQAGII